LTESIARRRLGAQRLVGEPLPGAVEVVRHLLAVQSQDYAGAKWALAQRVPATTSSELDALFDAGAFLRLHVMRPTWHFVAPEDLRWLVALTGPRVHQASAYQYRQLDVDPATARRAADVFERVLAGGRAMTRDELGIELGAAGIRATGVRLTYLVGHAEVEAILCSGPRRGARDTYALVEERVPPAPPRAGDEALAELAIRYLRGHGPAQDVDLAWWSGLTIGDARRAMAAAGPALRREPIGDRTFWAADAADGAGDADGAGSPTDHSRAPGAAPRIHLLPNYDELLVAFRDRTDALDPALPPPHRVAAEILDHVIVRDGLVVGRWRRPSANGGPLALEPRVPLAGDERELLARAVERYSTYVRRPIEVAWLD
jgi:hypothetical protein